MHDTHFSIAIVLYHTPLDQIEGCLISIASALPACSSLLNPESGHVVLIDNNPVPNTPDCFITRWRKKFSTLGFQFEVLHGHGNVGYGAANNRAMKVIPSTGVSVHLLMNPDTEIDKDCLKIGIEYLKQNPEVIALSPKCHDLKGAQQYLCKRYPSVWDLFLRGIPIGWVKKRFDSRMAFYEMRETSNDTCAAEIPIMSGCFMLCRGESFVEIGGFDERFFLYFEDFDLSLRLSRLGKLVYLPSMQIQHEGGNAATKGVKHIYMFASSAVRFFNLHGWRWI